MLASLIERLTLVLKMKLAIAALLAGSAAAFAPSASKAGSSALSMGYENELGVIQPTGFFDPWGLSDGIDQETFDQYRTAELKHGRVAQLAVCRIRHPGDPPLPWRDLSWPEIR